MNDPRSCRNGIASLRRLAIVRSSNSLSLSAVPSTAAEAFGQSESLTNRLRSIIGDYAESANVLLEVRSLLCGHSLSL